MAAQGVPTFEELLAERDRLARDLEEARALAPPLVLAGPPVIAEPVREVKLDLGCGTHPAEGYEGVDLFAENAAHRIDLLRFPWPWATSSVDALRCSHFIEHIPMVYADIASNTYELVQRVGTVDLLIAFFNECWRILKPNGTMLVVTPALQSVRAFQDPTHRRFLPPQFYPYLNADIRKSSAPDPDYYRYLGATCNFAGNANPIIPTELSLLSPEAQARRFGESWNTVIDWHAVLTALK